MFKKQLEYVMDIFLWVWQAELHHVWAPLTGHWAEWTLPFLARLPNGLWIEGNPGPQFQKWRINTRNIISRSELKRKTYKCHSLSLLSGFLTIVVSFWSIPLKWVSTTLSRGSLQGRICHKLPLGLYFHSLPTTTYTVDKVNRRKFLKHIEYSRYLTLCKDSL